MFEQLFEPPPLRLPASETACWPTSGDLIHLANQHIARRTLAVVAVAEPQKFTVNSCTRRIR